MIRFRIINENNYTVSEHNTLKECVEWVEYNEPGLNEYYIQDLKDNIEIGADEVLQAFYDGEYPMDLQFF